MPNQDAPQLTRRELARERLNSSKAQTQPVMPWEEEGVIERVPKTVLIKMSEPLKKKLEYVVEHTSSIKSQQKFLLGVIEAAIEEGLRKLGVTSGSVK